MKIYIDESGDLESGNINKKGRFFVLTALIPRTKNVVKRLKI